MEAVLTEPKVQIMIEEHIVLHDIPWNFYEQLMKKYEDSSAPRFAYNQGELEIYMPSQKHEEKAEFLTDIVKIITEELEIEILSLRSTTLNREELEKGAEPDGCFYLQSYDKVFGMKKIDLQKYPPDLVIEVDIFSPSINRFPIYAVFKVPEIWRYQKDTVKIFLFDGKKYVESGKSIALPKVTGEILTKFLADSETMKRSVWLKTVREWAREN